MEANQPRYQVLCLEDNFSEIQPAVEELGKALGTILYTADTYDKAIQLLTERHYDLFILDIELSEERTTGIQFAEEIRRNADYVCTPILFISIYNHFSYRILSRFQNSTFLKKPFTGSELTEQCGLLWNIPYYTQLHYQAPIFTVPLTKETRFEITSTTISYIEAAGRTIKIQYTDGRLESYRCCSGAFKDLLSQIKKHPSCRLAQVYRSVIVNTDQIRYVDFQHNTGNIWLFHDSRSLPLGTKYRQNIADCIIGMEELKHVES